MLNDYNSRNNWFNGRVKRFVERTNPICTNTEFSKCATIYSSIVSIGKTEN